MSRLASSFAAAAAFFVLRGSAAAVLTDHLECYTIKDTQPKTTYTATLTPGDNTLPVAPGCTVKVPAKVLCVDVDKSAVTPAPPGSAPGSQAQKYLCYKVKCPKFTKQTVPVQDQFGSRSVIIKAGNLVCAPFPAPTTTTTTSTTIPGSCATDADCPSAPNAHGVCVGGSCTLQCDTGYSDCNTNPGDGCEVSTASDPTNCGGCSVHCSGQNVPTPTCTNGVCNGACAAGFSDCNNNEQFDGCEVNVVTSPTDCGGCGNVCPSEPNSIPTCNSMTCGISCSMGFQNCDGMNGNGCEVSLLNDASNCGNCGHVCPVGTPHCVSGTCQP